MKALFMVLVLATLAVACSDSSSGDDDDSDNPQFWTCEEALTHYYDDCALFDDPAARAEEVCAGEGVDELVNECIKPNWPDCEKMKECWSG